MLFTVHKPYNKLINRTRTFVSPALQSIRQFLRPSNCSAPSTSSHPVYVHTYSQHHFELYLALPRGTVVFVERNATAKDTRSTRSSPGEHRRESSTKERRGKGSCNWERGTTLGYMCNVEQVAARRDRSSRNPVGRALMRRAGSRYVRQETLPLLSCNYGQCSATTAAASASRALPSPAPR